jgi:hypothetical protein
MASQMRIEPDDIDTEAQDDGTFVMTLDEYDGRGGRKRVRLVLKDWWLSILVNELRAVATKRAEDAKKLLDCFTNGA